MMSESSSYSPLSLDGVMVAVASTTTDTLTFKFFITKPAQRHVVSSYSRQPIVRELEFQ